MKMSIYDIDAEIMNCIDEETGEILDEKRLSELQMQRDKKIEGLALWYKNVKANVGAISDEIKVLEKRKKSGERLMESIEQYVKGALGGEKFNTGRVDIRYRSSESVDVYDISKLDKRFLRYAEPTADKTEIKRAIKAEGPIEGARLITNKNMIIK